MGPTWLQLSKPVIAAIEGHAVAGGLELALWCDLRIAARDAVFGVFNRRFGVPLIDLGTVRLPRMIGQGRALDLILTGRAVSGEEALQMGLVNKVVPAAQLRAEVEQWCGELLEKSPTALKLAKFSFNADTDHIHGITEMGFSALELYYGTAEAQEGRNAFIEKRKPEFRRKRS